MVNMLHADRKGPTFQILEDACTQNSCEKLYGL
jgi:hypothetical protein